MFANKGLPLNRNYYLIGIMFSVFAHGPRNRGSISGQIIPKTQKWYLIPPCLTLTIIKYGSKASGGNPGKGVAHTPTPQGCSCYWKGSLCLRSANLQPDIGIMVWVFANGPGDLGSIPGRVIPKTQKMVLDATLLNTQHCKVEIKGKVEQTREKSSAFSLHLGVVAIEKGAFGSPSITVANFTIT